MDTAYNGRETFVIHHFDGVKIAKSNVCDDVAMAVEPAVVDHFVNESQNRFEYRAANGEWIRHDWSQLGEHTLALLQVLQQHPRRYLLPFEIAHLTGYDSFRNPNTLAQAVRRLRKAHQEDARKPRFILTRRRCGLAYAWNRECSWMRVEPADLLAATA